MSKSAKHAMKFHNFRGLCWWRTTNTRFVVPTLRGYHTSPCWFVINFIQFHYILFNLIQLFEIIIGGTGFRAKLQHLHLCKAFLGALILLHRPHAKRCRTCTENQKLQIANCLASYLSYPQTRTLLHTDVDVNPPMPWDARMSGFVVLTKAFLKFNTCARNGDFMSKFHGAMRRKRKRKGREKQRKT